MDFLKFEKELNQLIKTCNDELTRDFCLDEQTIRNIRTDLIHASNHINTWKKTRL